MNQAGPRLHPRAFIKGRSWVGGTPSLVEEFIPKGVTYGSTASVSTYCKVCEDTVDTVTFAFDSNVKGVVRHL